MFEGPSSRRRSRFGFRSRRLPQSGRCRKRLSRVYGFLAARFRSMSGHLWTLPPRSVAQIPCLSPCLGDPYFWGKTPPHLGRADSVDPSTTGSVLTSQHRHLARAFLNRGFQVNFRPCATPIFGLGVPWPRTGSQTGLECLRGPVVRGGLSRGNLSSRRSTSQRVPRKEFLQLTKSRSEGHDWKERPALFSQQTSLSRCDRQGSASPH